jgi:lipid-binding SYLF domain-containing protein
MKKQSRVVVWGCAALLALAVGTTGSAQSQSLAEESKRIQKSIDVLQALTAAPDDGIPKHLLQRAEAIIVIPDLLKGGFVVGGSHGKGVVSVRNGSEWSAPAFVKMTGGSIGWQIGVQSVDLVLLVMNRQGVEDLLSNKFKIGGNLSLAAGPVGRAAEASTDAKFSSQILAYSRAKGLFAGATLEGAGMPADDDDNADLYGGEPSLRDIVLGSRAGTNVPPPVAAWKDAIKKIAG